MSKYRDKREKFRERAERETKEREKGGAGKYSCVNFSKEGEVKFFKPSPDKKRRNLIDIIPFFATQDWISKMKNHNGALLGIEPGEMLYKLETPVHNRVGEEGRTFLCLKFAFGKSCPICNEREAMKESDEPDEDLIKSLYPQWKVYYNIRDRNEEEKGSKRKVWESSYNSFERKFLEEADMGDDGIVVFADPEEGKTLKFKGKQKSFPTKEGKREFIEADSIEFLDREKQYGEEDIEKSISFDRLLIIPTYEEVEKAYLGIEDEEKSEKSGKEEKHKKHNEDEN